ncbi:hypothetical protein CR513_18821, partial [Mucuna pruriens]
MFGKVEINIPLLDAIKQNPKYAKFIKELCVHKRQKMKGIHNLSDSEDDNIDLADLSHKDEWIKLLDQVCKYENPECVNKEEVQVTETKKLFPTQVATIFTAKYEPTKEGQDRERAKVILAKKTSVKVDPHVPVQAESISAKEDQFDFSAKQRVKYDSNPIRIDSIPAKRSRSQQPKAEIMSAHLVPSSTQVDQLDPKESNDNSSSPPPPMELKPSPRHLKYAYLDVE